MGEDNSRTDDVDLQFTIGAELEFYVFDAKNDFIVDLTTGKFPQKFYEIKPAFKQIIEDFTAELASYEFTAKQESGPGQFEVEFKPYPDPQQLVNKILEFRILIERLEVKYQINVNFHPKPVPDSPGSALHIHISSQLFDPYGLIANKGVVQAKRDADNEYVLYAIGGLLERMPQDIAIFLPDEESRKRIIPYMNAPTKICWGRNNRSVALRIPDSKPKRIEHRVSGSNAEPAQVIKAVMDAAAHGIRNKIKPDEPIWGNAWDAIYDRKGII